MGLANLYLSITAPPVLFILCLELPLIWLQLWDHQILSKLEKLNNVFLRKKYWTSVYNRCASLSTHSDYNMIIIQHSLKSHKIYWDLTRCTEISRDLTRSTAIIWNDILHMSFVICHLPFAIWNLTFDIWHLTFDIWHQY